jgi:hypothetical protein
MAFALPLIMAGVAAVGAFAQGSSEAANYGAQQKALNYQADIEAANAKMVGQQASAEEERVRREGRQVLGAQRAAIAESGTSFSGSNLDVMRQSTTAAELDALNVQYAGNVERIGLLNQEKATRFNAKVAGANKKSANKMRWLSAIGAGLSGYGGAGGKSYMGSAPGKG